MKKYLLTLLLIVCSTIVNAQVKNLGKLPKAKRDSILLDIAKKTVLKYGPDYYEINRPPLIERTVIPAGYKDAGRVEITVKYYYKDEFYKKYPNIGTYLVTVYIWEDTGLAFSIMFEDRGISGFDKVPKTKGGKHPVFKRGEWFPVK